MGALPTGAVLGAGAYDPRVREYSPRQGKSTSGTRPGDQRSEELLPHLVCYQVTALAQTQVIPRNLQKAEVAQAVDRIAM